VVCLGKGWSSVLGPMDKVPQDENKTKCSHSIGSFLCDSCQQDLDEKMWIGHKFVGASMVGRVTGSVIDASPWICLSKALENERPVILDSKSFILLSHVSCLEVKLVCVHV